MLGMKSLKWPKHSFMILAVVATWIKTVIVYHTSFEMKIENAMQQFILFINPLSFFYYLRMVYRYSLNHRKQEIVILLLSVLFYL